MGLAGSLTARPSPAIGTEVVVIGAHRSAETSVVVATIGSIAGPDAIARRYGVIAHTAPLNPDNSCGPLLSLEGRVLGVNVGSATFEHEAVSYAVPYGTIEQQITDRKSRLVVVQEPPEAMRGTSDSRSRRERGLAVPAYRQTPQD